MRRKGGLGWIPGGSLNAEHQFLHGLNLRDVVVFDVGAFEGILTVFFASKAKQVVSFEPSANFQRLVENVQLNDLTNGTCFTVRLGAMSGTAD